MQNDFQLLQCGGSEVLEQQPVRDSGKAGFDVSRKNRSIRYVYTCISLLDL